MPTAETSTVLDEAFQRMAACGFEMPNGFVNHGAMACEALAALGFESEVTTWAERFARSAGPEVRAEKSRSFEWRDALGDYRRLPEWIGFFEVAIAGDGWPSVVEIWAPRLLPSLATALFHGAIRTGHAVRAVAAADTEARREELARALGYWAARWRSGALAGPPPEVDDLRLAIVDAAADGAHHYLARPNIFHLHGVTGAMAVDLLAPHIRVYRPGRGPGSSTGRARCSLCRDQQWAHPANCRSNHRSAHRSNRHRTCHHGGSQPRPAPGEAR